MEVRRSVSTCARMLSMTAAIRMDLAAGRAVLGSRFPHIPRHTARWMLRLRRTELALSFVETVR